MRATKFVESYFDAWNHRDPEGVVKHLSGDGVYCDIPLNEQHSHDDWTASLEQFFSRNQQRYELIGDVLTGSNTIAFQYRVLLVEGAGASVSRGAEFMTLDHGAAVQIMDYYDLAETVDRPVIAQKARAQAESGKYAKSGLTLPQSQAYKRRLDELMSGEQLFRSPHLTLPELAAAVGCSVNHLSQVINAECGRNFFDYLNDQRVELACDLLSNQAHCTCAILDIAFTVGFNSNSAFYAAFKKRVGQTPAQFRRTRGRITG